MSSPPRGTVILLAVSFSCASLPKGQGWERKPPVGSASRNRVTVPLALIHSLDRNGCPLLDSFVQFQETVVFPFTAPNDKMSRILYYSVISSDSVK